MHQNYSTLNKNKVWLATLPVYDSLQKVYVHYVL